MNKKIKQMIDTMGAVAVRFPVAVLVFLANVWFSLVNNFIDRSDDRFFGGICMGGIAALVSTLAQLVAERFSLRKNCRILLQAGSLLLYAILLFLLFSCRGKGSLDEWFFLSVLISGLGLAAPLLYFLGKDRGEDEMPLSLAYAALLAGSISFGIAVGFSVILIAIDKLLFDVHDNRSIPFVWYVSFFTVGLLAFLAYATKRERFEIPKFFKAFCVYLLLPIYVIYLAVLWIYLLRCCVLLKLPNGEVNWLVSMASAGFILLYLILSPFNERILRLFRERGAWALLPLIGIQMLACFIRYSAYGLTHTRYLSWMYIGFAILFLFVTLWRRGRYVRYSFWGFAFLCLFSTISPWNAIRTGIAAQRARIERIYKSHGLFRNGVIQKENAAVTLNDKERRMVSESVVYIDSWRNKDGKIRYKSPWNYFGSSDWKSTFRNTYGFDPITSDGTTQDCRTFSFGKSGYYSKPIPVSGYRTVSSVHFDRYFGDRETTRIEIGGPDGTPNSSPDARKFDITESVITKLQAATSQTDDGIWEIDLGNGKKMSIYYARIYYWIHPDQSFRFHSAEIDGFVLE